MNTPNLFCAALGLSLPWRVVSVHFAPGESKERGKLEVRIDFERGSELPCPKCQKACKSYDTDEQSWRHLNFFEHETYLIARVPRVSCEAHGVLKADVPWARPGSGFTLLFEAYVMALAPEIPVAGLARMVGEHDTRLWRVVEWHVADARARVNMSEVVSVVVDETSRAKRYSYVSLFLEPKKLDGEGKVVSDARVLFVTEGRSHDAFHRFVADLKAHGGKPEEVKDVCMDMSPSYQRGAAETLPWAAVTFDRFHVMKLISDALDDVRRLEHKARPELKRSRYVWLKNPADLSASQRERLEKLSTMNLLTAKAYQMRLNLRLLWNEPTQAKAERYLKRWCRWVRRLSRRPKEDDAPWVMEPMHRVAKSVLQNAEGILNYFRLRMTSGVIESVNSLAQAARARARGYRKTKTFMTMIYLIAGRLRFELPSLTHSP